MAGFHALLTAVTSAREKLEERKGKFNDYRDDLSSDGAADASVSSDSSPDRSSSPEGYESSTSSSFRGKRRSGAVTREQHNRLEKNRRALQRTLLSSLKKTLGLVDRKASHLSVLQMALCEVIMLKDRRTELCQMKEQLLSEQDMLQQRISALRHRLRSKQTEHALASVESSSQNNLLPATQQEKCESRLRENCQPPCCPVVLINHDEDEEVDVTTTEEDSPCLHVRPQQEMTPSPPMGALPILLEAHALTHNSSCLLMKIPQDAKVPFGYSSSQTLVTVSPQQLKETCSHAGLLYRHGDHPAFPVYPQGWLCT